jgi:two-component system nitrate/nitrite response regulator NarL
VPAAQIRVLVAEDHPLYRQGLADIREHEPDVAVLDVKMPKVDGLQVLRAVRREGAGTRIILLSAFIDGELVHQALTVGAAGFLSKESTAVEVCEAVAIAARGDVILAPEMQAALAVELRLRAPAEGPRLSERETQILALLAEGLSSGEIARELDVSATTVKSHLRHLYEKLEVSDRAAAVARAMRVGLLE